MALVCPCARVWAHALSTCPPRAVAASSTPSARLGAARLNGCGSGGARRGMMMGMHSWAPQPSEWQEGYPFSGRLRPASRAPPVEVDPSLPRPDFGMEAQPRPPNTAADIEALRASGQLAAQILDQACAAVAVGVTTEEVDAAAHSACVAAGAYPTGLGFRGFPKSCCTSVNEVVCHGIPDSRPLEEGDVVTIDCVAFHNGFHGDNARTVVVGSADEETEALALAAKECVEQAIAVVGAGVNYHALAVAVHGYASKHGFSVIREYGGHGIGRSLHMPPVLSFHPSHMPRSYTMEVGHTFTIEPMIACGSNEIEMWGDGWTVVTRDGGRAAQYEHMVVVTDDGCEVLTRTPACEQLVYP